MLIEVVLALRDSGATVDSDVHRPPAADSRVDAVLDVTVGATTARFVVEERQRVPYPNELSRLGAIRERLAPLGEPTLVVPFVSEVMASALISAGWSWADAAGNFDMRAGHLVLRQRRTTSPPRPTTQALPQGAGSLGIVRALIGFGGREREDQGATALAGQANVSQPRASQVLRRLLELGLVTKSSYGRWVPDREALLDRFLAEYRGPGGSEQYLYSLDPPTDVAGRAAGLGTPGAPVAISADVGPDLLLAWRRPTIVVIYSLGILDPGELGLVAAQGRHDANVIIRNPDDTSVFPVHELVADFNGADIPLVDATQQIWDLQDLGGADRLEAAGMLSRWLLDHH